MVVAITLLAPIARRDSVVAMALVLTSLAITMENVPRVNPGWASHKFTPIYPVKFRAVEVCPIAVCATFLKWTKGSLGTTA